MSQLHTRSSYILLMVYPEPLRPESIHFYQMQISEHILEYYSWLIDFTQNDECKYKLYIKLEYFHIHS